MKRVVVPVLLFGLLMAFAKGGMAADSDQANSDQAKVIAEIEKLGGQVTVDTESPTNP